MEIDNDCKVFGRNKFCKEKKTFELCVLCVLGLIEKHLYNIQKSISDREKVKKDK